MHIYEGVLSATAAGQGVLLGGAVVAVAGTAVGLAKLGYEQIPRAAVLSSVFFVASSIQVPLGPTCVHLVLGGLMGLVLGWSAFPAVLIALILQTMFVGTLGLTTLGLNTTIMALPAVVCYYLFHRASASRRQGVVFLAGFAAGCLAILLGGLLSATALMLAGSQYAALGRLFLTLHVPVAVVEGLVTGSVVVLLRKVRPEVLAAEPLAAVPCEAHHG
jgi:cobalt/nickel transport system permease protein